jgi:hypothetical protein
MAQADILQQAYNYFVSVGYKPHQAAAIVGNMKMESWGNPTIRGDGGKAFGSFQWHPDRQAKLDAFVQDQVASGRDPNANRNDPQTQWAFKDWEFKNTEKAAGDRLRASADVREANNAVLSDLRPAGYSSSDPTGSAAYDARLRYSASLAGVEPGEYVGRHDLPVSTAAGDNAPADGLAANALKGWGSKGATDALATLGKSMMAKGQAGQPVAGVQAAPDPGVFQPQVQQPGFFNAYRARAGLLGGAK